MAKQTINLGTAPNDGTGDTARASFDKCNDNFDELYAAAATHDADIGSIDGRVTALEGAPSGVAALDDVGDVNASTPADGDVLTWDATPGEWVPAAPAGGGGGATEIDDLTDVDTTTDAPNVGDVLEWDGTNWVPAAPSGGSSPLTALYEEQQAAGTGGGTATSGSWLTRALNTEVYDDIGISLSSNQLSLPAGTYEIDATTPFYRTGRSRARLQNVTGATVTLTIASPCVVTLSGHGFAAGTPITFSTTGALPTGLSAGTTYFVISPTSNTFQVAATPGGSAVNTSGSQSGTHTVFATLATSDNQYISTGTGASEAFARLNGRFTLAATTLVELQYRVESTFSPNGLGVESNMTYNNIYSRVKLTQLA